MKGLGDSGILVKIIVIAVVAFAVLWIVGMVPHIFFGVPLDSFS